MTNKLEHRLYELLSDEYCGNETMPLGNRSLRVTTPDGCERVVMFTNDAFDLGFGYPDEWQMIIRREYFHQVMRWYLKQWAFGEWFGLKRKIWYVLLHRKVTRY